MIVHTGNTIVTNFICDVTEMTKTVIVIMTKLLVVECKVTNNARKTCEKYAQRKFFILQEYSWYKFITRI